MSPRRVRCPSSLDDKAEVPRRARQINAALAQAYPRARCTLDHGDAFQLLVAVVLSAQSTDKRVNEVTPELFCRWPDAATLRRAKAAEVEAVIRSVGFFRVKTKALITLAAELDEKYDGRPPRSMAELVALPGVGRKTANVLLGNAYKVPGLAVDTHVTRLARRWGLTAQTAPEKIERDLTALLPPREWARFSHRAIAHGRAVCKARCPACPACFLNKLCPAAENHAGKKKAKDAVKKTTAARKAARGGRT